MKDDKDLYSKEFKFVKDYLVNSGGEFVNNTYTPFRKRSDHIKRVFLWAQRLINDDMVINKKALLTAAIFHDVGYSVVLGGRKHAEESAVICEKYLKENGFDSEFIDFVVYLVKNHSNKEVLISKNVPLELVLLIEADLLDETGALSIVWDCMMEGNQELQTFEKTFDHICDYSYRILSTNPMVTDKAKAFWQSKQRLMDEFLKQLSFDLGLDNEKII